MIDRATLTAAAAHAESIDKARVHLFMRSQGIKVRVISNDGLTTKGFTVEWGMIEHGEPNPLILAIDGLIEELKQGI